MELIMIRDNTNYGHIYGQIRDGEKWIADTDELIAFSIITAFEDILCSHLHDGVYSLEPVFMSDEGKMIIGIYDDKKRMRSAFVQDNQHRVRGIKMWNENGRIEVGKSDNFRQLKERAQVFASFYHLISAQFQQRKKVILSICTLNDCKNQIEKYKLTPK